MQSGACGRQWVVDMRTWVLVVLLAGVGACNFDSSGHASDDPKLRAGADGKTDAGQASLGSDAAPDATGGAGTDAPVTGMDATAATDATVPKDAGGDGGQLSKPDDPAPPEMTGGLKCGEVFCPFAEAPIEPCCTLAADVEGGAAREVDRCGLNFGKLDSDFFAGQCWERDQPGLVDESCPPVQVDLRSVDPGCCTDKGQCGGSDSEHGLGCHADPSSESKRCGAPVTEDDAGVPPGECDLTGRYALQVEVDMTWGGRSGGLWELTDDGRGKLRITMLLDIEQVDATTMKLSGVGKPCGVELPSFYSSTLCEAYQPIFPARLWESTAMPQFAISGQVQCSTPGCIASIDAQTYLLGVELSNPEAPWPTEAQTEMVSCPAGSGAKCFPDHDADGRAGLTVELAKQGTLPATGEACSNRDYAKRGAPLSSSAAAIFNGVRRSDRILLGVRMKIGGSAILGEECRDSRGSGIAEFVNSRAWGCIAQQGTYNYPFGARAGANDPCTATEASFMDANLPIYNVLPVGEKPSTMLDLTNTTPSKGPTIRLKKIAPLGSDVSCEAVRAAVAP
jgi:hypothetical protein